jgi:hypothetical protein
MKMQFVFGNPTKKSSFPKSGKPVKSSGRAKSLLERLKVGKKKNPYNKPSERKKLEKLMYEDLKKKAKRSSAAQKGVAKRKIQAENKKLKKAVRDLEDLEVELLDSSIKEKNMAKKKSSKGKGKSKGKAKGKKKSAPKSSKASRKKAGKKAAATRKRNKKKAEAEKEVKKSAKKSSSRKRRGKGKGKKKGGSKRTTKRVKRAAPKKRSGRRKPKSKKRYVYQKGYRLSYKRVGKSQKGKRHYRKNKKGTVKYMWARNPIGGAMSQLEKFTGMSMPEAGGLLVGGLAYGAVNSLLSRIPVVKTVHAQLLKVPVVGSALPTLLAGALLNWAGDKYKMKAASMLGKGLVGAAVVGMGVNASQLVPGLKGMSGVDLTMGEGQLGLNEADFGEDNPADFGELIEYNDQALSGVDYTMNGVDLTMGEDNPADFGELIQMNEQALSGGQLG